MQIIFKINIKHHRVIGHHLRTKKIYENNLNNTCEQQPQHKHKYRVFAISHNDMNTHYELSKGPAELDLKTSMFQFQFVQTIFHSSPHIFQNHR